MIESSPRRCRSVQNKAPGKAKTRPSKSDRNDGVVMTRGREVEGEKAASEAWMLGQA